MSLKNTEVASGHGRHMHDRQRSFSFDVARMPDPKCSMLGTMMMALAIHGIFPAPAKKCTSTANELKYAMYTLPTRILECNRAQSTLGRRCYAC
jgi:hypothetical protein